MGRGLTPKIESLPVRVEAQSPRSAENWHRSSSNRHPYRPQEARTQAASQRQSPAMKNPRPVIPAMLASAHVCPRFSRRRDAKNPRSQRGLTLWLDSFDHHARPPTRTPAKQSPSWNAAPYSLPPSPSPLPPLLPARARRRSEGRFTRIQRTTLSTDRSNATDDTVSTCLTGARFNYEINRA